MTQICGTVRNGTKEHGQNDAKPFLVNGRNSGKMTENTRVETSTIVAVECRAVVEYSMQRGLGIEPPSDFQRYPRLLVSS